MWHIKYLNGIYNCRHTILFCLCLCKFWQFSHVLSWKCYHNNICTRKQSKFEFLRLFFVLPQKLTCVFLTSFLLYWILLFLSDVLIEKVQSQLSQSVLYKHWLITSLGYDKIGNITKECCTYMVWYDTIGRKCDQQEEKTWSSKYFRANIPNATSCRP